MAGTKGENRAVLKEGFRQYMKYIYLQTERELRQYSWMLLEEAIKWRQRNPSAHNFTGNLLNSIVVCLYKDGAPVIAYFSSSLVPEAIRPKMRYRARRSYVFNPDYDGSYGSKYRPQVQTNGGWGKDDAERFFGSYRPSPRHMFDIVVAYSTEYAEYIEQVRNTTGVLATYMEAKRLGTTFMEIAS